MAKAPVEGRVIPGSDLRNGTGERVALKPEVSPGEARSMKDPGDVPTFMMRQPRKGRDGG